MIHDMSRLRANLDKRVFAHPESFGSLGIRILEGRWVAICMAAPFGLLAAIPSGCGHESPPPSIDIGVLTNAIGLSREVVVDDSVLGRVSHITVGNLTSHVGDEIGIAGDSGIVIFDTDFVLLSRTELMSGSSRTVRLLRDLDGDGNVEIVSLDENDGRLSVSLLNGMELWSLGDAGLYSVGRIDFGDLFGNGEVVILLNDPGADSVYAPV